MRSIGLDLSDTAIRIVVIEQRGTAWHFPVRAEIPVPAGMIVDGEMQQSEGVVELLKQLFSAAKVKPRNVVVGLPERHSFIKLVSLPGDDDRAIAESIQDVATQHVPYAWDEMYFDWSILPTRNSRREIQVLLGASPKVLVDSYLSVLDQAGVDVVACEIESSAIVRALWRPNEQTGAKILLDLGRARSTLILVDNGQVQFSTSVRYAGKDLNKFIADQLDISQAQAERAQNLFGLDPNRGRGVLRNVLLPHLNVLVKKIEEVESFYADHFVDHQPVTMVGLTGSGAMLRGLSSELASRLKQSIAVQPCWLYQDLQHHDPHMTPEVGYAYATAIGLALRPFMDHDRA